MREFSLLLKPAGADCNLRCGYCFYLKKAGLYPGVSRHRMTDEVLEQVIGSFMRTEQSPYCFAWQGGEPLLMGLDFFKRVTALQRQHGRPGAVVVNSLQTNGTLIDDNWARHFAEYQFLLGVSLDGPEAIHDHYRNQGEGLGSHRDVMKGIDALKRARVEFNILTVVSQANVKRAEEVYRYLVEQGFMHHQYIECVEFGAGGERLPFSVSAEQWGGFLCELFDLWYPADTHRVSVRLFDSILMRMVDGVANVCSLGTDCRKYLVVEHNGDIYPCDFFVEPALKLGNIQQGDWSLFWDHPRFKEFGAGKAKWNARCAGCAYLSLCGGDCQRHRYDFGRNPPVLSALCAGWKLFFEHTLVRFQQLAGDIRREREETEKAMRRKSVAARLGDGMRVGRNEPCPCGGGKKFKKCCGKR